MKIKLIILTLVLILTILGCKEEFLLQSKNYSRSLVVDGIFTNEDTANCIVELSFSTPVNNIEKIPYSDCIVTLTENNTKSEILTEIKPGIYKLLDTNFKGTIRNQYSLTIETPNGKIYNSEPQVMKPSIEIESLYTKLIFKEDLNYVYGLPGYQFYTSSKIAEDKDSYILWRMIETYQYRANKTLADMWNVDFNTLLYYTTLSRCWKTQNVKYFFTGKTTNLESPQILNQPLHFVGTETKRLQERYSLLLKQYSIDELAYNYWKSIESQLSQENFLTVNQPINIIGNVKNINNPSEYVYGYFTVAAVTQKRIYVNSPKVPFYYNDDCGLISLKSLEKYTTPVFLVVKEDGEMAGVSEWCVNCEIDGGKAKKPDFWIDK